MIYICSRVSSMLYCRDSKDRSLRRGSLHSTDTANNPAYCSSRMSTTSFRCLMRSSSEFLSSLRRVTSEACSLFRLTNSSTLAFSSRILVAAYFSLSLSATIWTSLKCSLRSSWLTPERSVCRFYINIWAAPKMLEHSWRSRRRQRLREEAMFSMDRIASTNIAKPATCPHNIKAVESSWSVAERD